MEITEELSEYLRGVLGAYKKEIKKDPESTFDFVFTDGFGNILKFNLSDVPDFSAIYQELDEPEELKLEIYKNGQLVKAKYLIKKKPPVHTQAPPPYPIYPQQPQTPSFDVREFMASMEKITAGVLAQTQTMFSEMQKFNVYTIEELKKQTQSTIEEIKKTGKEQIEEKEKFYKDLLNQQTNYTKNFVESRSKEDQDFFNKKLEMLDEHNKAIRELELEKIKIQLSPDKTSSFVNSAKDLGSVVKSAVEGVADVIKNNKEAIMEVVEISQAMKANPVNGISSPIDIPGVE